MYRVVSRCETGVTLLAVRAGSPPSAIELFKRFFRLKRADKLNELWAQWENWFAEVEETHTSLAALPFFRSPQPQRSWVTAAGTVLDAAALAGLTVALPPQVPAGL